MSRFLLGVLCLLSGCSGARDGGRPDSLPRQSAAGMAQAPAMTPGVCGYRELADSSSRADCRQRLFRPTSQDIDLAANSDCGRNETGSADSLDLCFRQMDSLASACPIAHSWRVRQADGVARRAEWRRCGPQGGATLGDSIVWPAHFLLLRRDTAAASPLIFSFSNSEEPSIGGLDTVEVVDLDGDGTDELFFVNQDYGTGASFEDCALAVSGGRIACWTGPQFPERARALKPGEVTYKGWVRMFGGPGVDRESAGPELATGKSIWYFTPVYREGDPNCCSSANASLWVESIPRQGHFETGLVLRATEDSNQAILSLDTLAH